MYVQRQLSLDENKVQDFIEVRRLICLATHIYDRAGFLIASRFSQNSCGWFAASSGRRVVYCTKLRVSAYTARCVFASKYRLRML